MKRLFSILMLAAIFSVAVFATTTAVPKFDPAAVVTKVSVTVDRKKTPQAYRLQSCTQETSRLTSQAEHPLIFENQDPVPVIQTGFG